MKRSVNSNMYEVTLNSIWTLFKEYLSGEQQALILAVSTTSINASAHKALQSSFARLGYGKAACTFLTLSPHPKAPLLSNKELCSLLEGLDPKIIIILDEKSAKLCGEAYSCELKLDTRTRLFGRETRVFVSFETMLTDSASKQKAWSLLKSLPKLSLS